MNNKQHREETKKHAEFVSNHLKIGMWQKDYPNHVIDYMSEGMGDILQYPLQDLYDQPDLWADMIYPDDKDHVRRQCNVLQSNTSLDYHYRMICGDGSVKWVHDQTRASLDSNGEIACLFGTLTDMTSEIEIRRQLTHLSAHNDLTSLPNRQSLYHKLDNYCSYHTGKPFALLHINLDRFQLINDYFGYTTGDQLLQKTTNRLLSVLPEETYLAHISDNDFMVLMNYTYKSDATQTAARIIESLQEPFHVDETDFALHITASIGISYCPSDGDEKRLLLQNANNALSQAKALGKNNYQLYEASQETSASEILTLEEDMRKALKNEAFMLYYQPLVDTSTGYIKGAEALLRWYHAERGFVSPSKFVPLAEKSHLIHQLGRWVIQTVCRQLRDWADQGLPRCPVAINVSPIQFMKEDLIPFIEAQLNKYAIPAKYLELEITEGSFLKNDKAVLNKLHKLSHLGVKIAIDDFGTGFSSLIYLKEFSPDIIKIDKGFIQNVGGDHTVDSAITAAVLHLAQSLNMTVIAEGVEEQNQLEFLRKHHCDVIQGFLFSKPVPIEAFELLLASGYLKPIPVEA